MMFPVLSTFLLGSGVWLALLCALVGLGFAYYLVRSVISCSPGNDRMRQIASAVEEGAKAYLNRQLVSVGVIAAVIFVILIFARGFYTSLGFLVGAACSMAAGYIGMRIAEELRLLRAMPSVFAPSATIPKPADPRWI